MFLSNVAGEILNTFRRERICKEDMQNQKCLTQAKKIMMLSQFYIFQENNTTVFR